VLVVSGEAGIGKSRFCDEIAELARAAGLVVVAARCWVDGGAPALWPWQPILSDLCGRDAADLLASDAGSAAVDPDRFARFGAVTERLAEACERTPACLVVDDIHAADVGTLLLTRFVTRSLHRLSLTVVLSRRSGEPGDAGHAGHLLDEIEREAVPVVLRPFDLDETVSFLASHGLQHLDSELVLTVLRVTGGNPLFLRRVAALGAAAADGLPDGLSAAIDQAWRGLSPATQRVLMPAAVLGLTPTIPEAAAVAQTTPVAVLDAVGEAKRVGLVTNAPWAGAFAFGHELVRSALEEALVPTERLDAHARAAPVVASDGPASPDRLARRAHHALAAAPRSPDDARLAVSVCQAAAQPMVRSFAYEQADALLTAAVALHDSSAVGPAPARLLVEWAQAALLCGRLGEARVRFDRAATVAEREGDAVLFAEAALGLGGHWVHEHRAPVARARVLGLQRSASAQLSGSHEALRCRLRARLAAEDVYDGGPIEPVHEALAAARACGDPEARAEALSLGHHALLAPEHGTLRLGLADELIQVASEGGSGVLALMGLCWRAVDLFLLGDDRAVRALADLRERADALACQNILYIVEVLDVMLLVRAGHLDEAKARAEGCYELGVAVGEIDALGYLAGHTLAIRWIQGRDAELLDLAEQVAASPTLVPGDFSFHAAVATIAARAGHVDRARAALDHLAVDGLAALPTGSTWLAGMWAIVEATTELGDADLARDAYDLLVPFADLPVMPSLAIVCVGSTERQLGLAALTFGDPELAVDHLERAVVACRNLGNRPLVAISRSDLARALVERDRDADRDRAVLLLDQAIDDSEIMGMAERAATWRSARSAIQAGRSRRDDRSSDDEGGDEATRRARGSASRSDRSGVICREGRGWLVAVDDRRALVGDLVGMGYLAELLLHPGQAFSALVLSGGDRALGDTAPQPMLDDRARAEYAARARELGDDLADADSLGDLDRAERLQAEMDALADQIEAATGLGGRSRAFTGSDERARTAVSKALRRAVDQIDAVDPEIAGTLRTTVSIGMTCIYVPEVKAPVSWSADRGAAMTERHPPHDAVPPPGTTMSR